MIDQLRQKAGQQAKRGALGLSGVILLSVGIGFGTAALFLLLAEMRDALFACFIIALIYTSIGVIILAFAIMNPEKQDRSQAREPSSTESTWAAIIAAFSEGVAAGKETRRDRNR